MTVDATPGAAPGAVPLFTQGFRPFFLLAGLVAVGVMLPWTAALQGVPVPDGPLPLSLWHMHEMLAGFIGAAMAGFLLTAIPNWLGGPDYGGVPLAVAAALYLAARLALAPGSPVPVGAAALLALTPLPLLLLWIAPALLRSGTPRLFGPPLIVLLFWSADLLMLGDAAQWWGADTWNLGKLLALDTAVLMVGLIGGRIVPSFTVNALRKRGQAPELRPAFPRGDEAANLSLAAVVLVDLAAPGGTAAGVAAASAALLCALRLSRWHAWRVAHQPILLVLHLAWGFVPLGLLVKALALLAGILWAFDAWLHLLAAGALGLMVLAVMTRATLGHTGRALRADAATALAYALVAAAALIRAFGPSLLPAQAAYGMAGLSWSAGFALFLWRFGPMLAGPRADRR